MTTASASQASLEPAPFRYPSILEAVTGTATALASRAREAGLPDIAALFDRAAQRAGQLPDPAVGRVEEILEEAAQLCADAGEPRLARIAENLARMERLDDADAAWLPAVQYGMEGLGFTHGPTFSSLWLLPDLPLLAGVPTPALRVTVRRRYEAATLAIAVVDVAVSLDTPYIPVWRRTVPLAQVPAQLPEVVAVMRDPELPTLAALIRRHPPAGS